MKLSIAVCCTLAVFFAGAAGARLPLPSQEQTLDAAAAQARAAEKSKTDAQALSRAHDRVVENYKQNRKRAAALLEKKRAADDKADSRIRPVQSKAEPKAVKAAELAKQQAEALARAQDRAVANYRRNKGLTVAKPAARGHEKLTCFTGDEDRHARIGVELFNERVTYFAYYSKWKPRTCSIEVSRDGPYSRWEDNGTTSTVTLVDHKGVFLIERKGRSYRFGFRDVDRGRYCGMDGKINGSLVVVPGRSKCELQGVMDGHES